jgi:hypothetical protein
MPDKQRYCAYMLRGWLEMASDGEQMQWRFRLRDVQSGEEHAFASIGAVIEFLNQAFGQEDKWRIKRMNYEED